MALTKPDARYITWVSLMFIGLCSSSQSPRPIEIQAPQTIVSKDSAGFIIELREDSSVWWRIGDSAVQSSQKIEEPIRANLAQVIADYKKDRIGRPTMFLVLGHPKSKYIAFERIINALRDNNDYKYSLVTTDNNGIDLNGRGGDKSVDLFVPKPSRTDTQSKYENIVTKLTLLLVDEISIYGYEGNNLENGKTFDYTKAADVIAKSLKKFGDKLVVVVKTRQESGYKGQIDILDELMRSKIQKVEVIEMSGKEKIFIKTRNITL